MLFFIKNSATYLQVHINIYTGTFNCMYIRYKLRMVRNCYQKFISNKLVFPNENLRTTEAKHQDFHWVMLIN